MYVGDKIYTYKPVTFPINVTNENTPWDPQQRCNQNHGKNYVVFQKL